MLKWPQNFNIFVCTQLIYGGIVRGIDKNFKVPCRLNIDIAETKSKMEVFLATPFNPWESALFSYQTVICIILIFFFQHFLAKAVYV